MSQSAISNFLKRKEPSSSSQQMNIAVGPINKKIRSNTDPSSSLDCIPIVKMPHLNLIGTTKMISLISVGEVKPLDSFDNEDKQYIN